MPHLLNRLMLQFPNSSKSTLKKWIKIGRIEIDGKKFLNSHFEINEKTPIRLIHKQKFLPLDIEVVYKDQDLIVVNKPEGVLSVATAFESKQTVHGVLKEKFRQVFPVHRLDRETSGIMVMAFSETAHKRLKAQFHAHSIYREYYAVVCGKLKGSGTWKCRLLEDTNYFVRSHPRGDLAITHYTVLKTYKKTTAIQFRLETGKKNQIRAQALIAGYPILGDQKYGLTSSNRLHLHAYALDFIHPATGKKMIFKSSIPFEI